MFASAERSTQFRPYAAAARRDPSWRYVEVPATHWLMYSHPREVAAIILDPERALRRTMDADRILCTHTGSLPRPDDLVQIMWAVGDGIPVDAAALEARVEAAVFETVRRQIAAGVSIVNDGEMSKPSYATYVKDRLSGFDGESAQSYHFADLVDFPRSAELVAANPGRRKRSAPACTGPIAVADPEAAKRDMEHLVAATAGVDVAGTFSSAASPGVVSLFFANEYYDTREEYVFAIAEAMRHEYEAIAAAGATVQLDCPDLAMGRHTIYAGLDAAEFRRTIEVNIAALNHAVRNIPPEQLRMHLCWGNYPGPHHHDVPIAEILDVVWTAKPQTVLFEAANPRHAHEWLDRRRGRRARRQGDLSRRHRAAVQLHRASRAGRPTAGAMGDRGRPEPADGRRRLRVLDPRRHAGHRSRRRLGQARGDGPGLRDRLAAAVRLATYHRPRCAAA